MPESPKPSLFDPVQTLDFTLNPATGVIATAFKTPPRPAPTAPQVAAPISGAQSGEDIAFEQAAQGVEPSQFESFAPSSLLEEEEALRGSAGDVFSQAFGEGLLGFDKNVTSFADRERIKTSVNNFTATNPWTAGATAMAGRFASDLPLEIGISLVSGPLGAAGEAFMAARAIQGARLSTRLRKASEVFKKARLADPTKGLSFGAKTLSNAKVDFMEGMATGYISESWLQSMGREGDSRDVMSATATDAVGSVFFGFALRNAFSLSKKTYSKFRSDYIDRAAKDLEESSGVSETEIKSDLEREIPKTKEELRGEAADIDAIPRNKKAQSSAASEASRPPDVEAPARAKQTLSKNEIRHLDEVGKRATPARLRRGFEALLATPEKAGRLVDILSARAKSAGIGLEDYFKIKKLKFDVQDTISVLAHDGDMILTAPGRSASVGELVHEIGHIVRSDLDGKHLTDLEKFYRVEEGMPWTRDQEELFAEDVRKFLDGEKTEQPRGVRRAMKSFLDWVKNVYGKMFGMPTTASRDDVLARLFAETVADPFATPTSIKELRVASERAKAGAEQLFSPTQPSKKSTAREPLPSERIKEIDDATRINTERQREIVDRASESVAEGSKIPSTSAGKKWQRLKAKFGKLFGTNNVSLKGQLVQLGPIGKQIDDQFPQAAIDAASIKTKGEAAYNKFLDDRGWGDDRMREMAQDKLTATIGGKKITESKLWWVRKTLESMDGWNKDKTTVAKNSAQEKLVDEGFSYKGKKVKISPDQLKFLQKGGLLTGKEMELVGAIQAGYRAAGVEANKMVRSTTGRDFVDPENYYYVSQNTLKGDEVSGQLEVLLPSKESGTGRGAFHERTGGALLKEAHPINDMNKYINYVAETTAYARPAKELTLFLEHGGETIKESLSADYLESMENLAKVLSGDRAILGDPTDTMISKIYSLTVISQLGANPSVILKQFSSAWTAAATGKLLDVDGKQINGAKLFIEATALAKDPVKQTELKKIEAEIDKANDYFKQRRESKVRWVELEKIASELGVYERSGKLSVKELTDLAKKKGITKFDAWLASIEKLTEGIQVADRAQIAAIWNQSKVTVANTIDPSDPSFFKKVSDLAIDVTMDSQPTQDIVTKSMNQMNRNIFTKAVTQYTTQTRKIAEMADSSFTTYVNIDKTDMSKKEITELRETLWSALMPLAIQTGYAAAVGTVAGTGVAALKDLAKSKEQLRRLEKRRDGIMTKFVQNLLQGTVGVAPVAGAPISGLLIALTGGKPYGQNIPLFEQVQNLNEAIFERNMRNTMKALMSASGAPSIVVDPIATLAGRAVK